MDDEEEEVEEDEQSLKKDCRAGHYLNVDARTHVVMPSTHRVPQLVNLTGWPSRRQVRSGKEWDDDHLWN